MNSTSGGIFLNILNPTKPISTGGFHFLSCPVNPQGRYSHLLTPGQTEPQVARIHCDPPTLPLWLLSPTAATCSIYSAYVLAELRLLTPSSRLIYTWQCEQQKLATHKLRLTPQQPQQLNSVISIFKCARSFRPTNYYDKTDFMFIQIPQNISTFVWKKKSKRIKNKKV